MPNLQSKLKQFAGNSILYGLGEVLYKAVAFLLIPVYLKYLSPPAYGAMETLITTREIGIMLFAMGVPSALLKYYYDHADPDDRRKLISTSFWTYILLQIPMIVVMVLFRDNLSYGILKDRSYAFCFALLALNIFIISFRTIPVTLYRAQNRALKYAAVMFLTALFTLFFNIYFVAFLKKGVEGVLWGNFAGGIVGLALISKDIIRHIGLTFDRVALKKMLRYGLPVGLSVIPLSLIFLSDRYILVHFISLDEVGKYALAGKFANLLLIFFITPFQLTWTPFLLENHKEGGSSKLFTEIVSGFFSFGLLLAFLISVLAPFVMLAIAPKTYWEAVYLIPMLSFAILLYGIGFVFRSGILVSESTVAVSKIIIVGVMFSLFLNFLLVPKIGMYGASATMLLTFFIVAVYSYKEGQKRLPISYPLQRMLSVSVLAIVCIGVDYAVFQYLKNLSLTILSTMLIILIFLVGSHALGASTRHLFISLLGIIIPKRSIP